MKKLRMNEMINYNALKHSAIVFFSLSFIRIIENIVDYKKFIISIKALIIYFLLSIFCYIFNLRKL